MSWRIYAAKRLPGDKKWLGDVYLLALELAQFRVPHRGNRGVSTYALANSLEQGFPFLLQPIFAFTIRCLKESKAVNKAVNKRSFLYRAQNPIHVFFGQWFRYRK